MLTTFLDREIERLNTIGGLNTQGKAKLTEFKDIKEQLRLHSVGSRRGLLIEYEDYRWNVNGSPEINDIIDGFLKSN